MKLLKVLTFLFHIHHWIIAKNEANKCGDASAAGRKQSNICLFWGYNFPLDLQKPLMKSSGDSVWIF